ncbi:uncharacterized protein ACN427_009505 [Glossina fuscipes fuscipes]
MHSNATEAYPSVNPNPNAWEFLQNIGYYQYGAYFNISEFWDRVITCAMDRHYQEGEQRTFYIPTNDAFKGGIKRYHVNGTTILRNIIEKGVVPKFDRYNISYQVKSVTMAWGKGYPTIVLAGKNTSLLCWYKMKKCGNTIGFVLHSVFVSNGVVNFIDTIMGLNDAIVKNMASIKKVLARGKKLDIYTYRKQR